MSGCRQCGLDVLWALTKTGAKMPVDPEPNEGGNVAVYRDHLGQLRARVVMVGAPIEDYERRAMPHIATCVKKAPTPKPMPEGVVSLAAARDRRRQTGKRP